MRSLFDRPVFTTDVIVGFPGETEEEFCESMAFVESMRFLKVHVFSYSRRAGTVAYSLPNQVSEQQKAERSRRMIAAAEKVRSDLICTEWTGLQEEVLLEQPVSSGYFSGYTKSYIPVVIKAPGRRSGEIVPCLLGEFDGTRCQATAL